MGGKVTTTFKRCKGCVFWRPYAGEIANSAARAMMNQEAPRRAKRACVLRLRTVGEGDAARLVPSFDSGDEQGPHYGERVRPDFCCDHHTAKPPPHRRPRVVSAEPPAQAAPAAPAVTDADELVATMPRGV